MATKIETRNQLLNLGLNNNGCRPALRFLAALDNEIPLEQILDQIDQKRVIWLLWLVDKLDDDYDRIVGPYYNQRTQLAAVATAKWQQIMDLKAERKLTYEQYEEAHDRIYAEYNQQQAEIFDVMKEEVRQWLKSR